MKRQGGPAQKGGNLEYSTITVGQLGPPQPARLHVPKATAVPAVSPPVQERYQMRETAPWL